MSRSKKRTPCSTWCCCKSQKKGKQTCNRRFRLKEHVLLQQRMETRLPQRTIEVMETWDLGGDGKCFWGFHSSEDWYARLMRK